MLFWDVSDQSLTAIYSQTSLRRYSNNTRPRSTDISAKEIPANRGLTVVKHELMDQSGKSHNSGFTRLACF